MELLIDSLLYSISIAETAKGNYLKLCPYNSKGESSSFLFDLNTGKILHSEIDTDNETHKELYEKLASNSDMTLPKFIEQCISTIGCVAVDHNSDEPPEYFAEDEL